MTGAAAALVLMFAQPVLADGSFANGTSVNGVAVGGMSNEEAKAKLKEFNKKGLMQNGEDYAICNCDGYCCYPLQMARQVGSKGMYPKSHYEIDWHEDECINCGKCTKICNFGAFQKGEDKKVSYNKELCWGCTICAPNCPKGAIHLKPKAEE